MEAINFEGITLRQELTCRGGGIEISLDTLGYEDVKMTAYQNYLGGGMLGKVCSSCNLRDWRNDAKLLEISEELKKYFHSLTNPTEGWESLSYEQNQELAASAY